MIVRDLDRARAERFDVAIVGGGVQGAALLLDAARRGHAAVLVERDDFGGATTWNSLRLAHGGLRDLQRLDIRRCRAMAAEQAAWMRDFPDAVRPLPCVLPVGDRGSRRRLVGAGLAAHALVTLGARDRASVPAGRVVEHADVGTAARWFEGVARGPRLVIEMLRWACSLGALALHRAEVIGGDDAGLTVRDRLDGEAFTLRASRVIVAAGAATDAVVGRLADAPGRPAMHPSLAFNLLLDRPSPLAGEALALRVDDGTRLLVPLGDRVVAGTFHAPIDETDAPADTVSDALVDAAIDALNRARPELDLASDAVVRVLSGVLPVRRAGTTALTLRPIIRRHRFDLASVVAVKWTTARRVAHGLVDRCLGAWPGWAERASRPEPAVVPTLDAVEAGEAAALDAVRRLVDEEAVQTLDDLLCRRTDWALTSRDPDTLRVHLGDLLGLGDRATPPPRRRTAPKPRPTGSR